MSELPEVEITKRGFIPSIISQKVNRVILHRENLRWAYT